MISELEPLEADRNTFQLVTELKGLDRHIDDRLSPTRERMESLESELSLLESSLRRLSLEIEALKGEASDDTLSRVAEKFAAFAVEHQETDQLKDMKVSLQMLRNNVTGATDKLNAFEARLSELEKSRSGVRFDVNEFYRTLLQEPVKAVWLGFAITFAIVLNMLFLKVAGFIPPGK